MRIERHAVGEAALSAAVADFAPRMAGDVHRMQHDEFPGYGWEMIAESFLDYLGARSVDNPALEGKDCKLAFESAAAAALGAFTLDWDPGRADGVFIEYTGTGVSYGEGAEGRPATTHDWLGTFFLACVAGDTDRDAGLFLSAAAPHRGRAERPDVALVQALLAYVYGETGQREPAGSRGAVSAERRSEAIGVLAEELDPGTDMPHYRAALGTLRALAAGDRSGFAEALARQLVEHRERCAGFGDPRPRTLLPLDAIALAAMARWSNDWPLEVTSAYLPAAAVGGFAPPAPRVRAFGAGKRADALAALAAGPLVVDRARQPEPEPGDLAYEEFLARSAAEFADPGQSPALGARRLIRVMSHQYRLFLNRLALDPEGADEQGRAALRLGAEAGSAAVRLASAEPDTEVKVTVGGVTRALPAGARVDPAQWVRAAALALISGEPELLAGCTRADPALFTHGYVSATAAYGAALHDHLRGVDPRPAVHRALTAAFQVRDTNFLAPPVVLLSQLVEGDREGFALALADALEEHREYYGVADNGATSDSAVNLDVLALVRHARRLGWEVPVRSPYLPPGLAG
ncbi:immunity 49 family protein [Streptomyces sp. G-G2]|uniref:immunity 49 family protein n=1 Tax=Streptomyces sp. G-G2 TaxID=3046201 RepID=UPI0024B8AF70|nr:immunity 49 family protein [Streptomyces sp. G-G2]MDJ0380013.1 immunity 49 family protein [Streptomyces sp. G-G2]